MSHTIRVKKVQVTDVAALVAAVAANDDMDFVDTAGRIVHAGDVPARATYQLYGGKTTGIGVRLKGWKYPVVVNPDTGEVSFDNYGGTWGDMNELDGMVQGYVVELTRAQALAQNVYMAREETLEDGTVELTFQVHH